MKSVRLFSRSLLTGICFVVLMCASVANGDATTLASVFADHMVLQRDMPIKVWGWSTPGEVVTASFAGESANATTDAAGKWELQLPAQSASKVSRDFTVTSTSASFTRTDVVVGDVWLASGQF